MSRVDNALLAEQLRLLEDKKRQVPELLSRGDALGQDVADELVGIRIVILAALLRRGGEAEYGRDELRLREREARDLLREVVLPPRERHTDGGTGDLVVAS